MLMIRIEDLVVKFNVGRALEFTALAGINLEIRNGDFVVMIGGNGAGKSTLLNALTGAAMPVSGKIFIDDVDVTYMPVDKRAKYISKVFQDPLVGTCGNLSIEENFALFASRGKTRTLMPALLKRNIDSYRDKVASLKLGLEDRMREPIGRLSGGQRQVLSLIMATQSEAKLLLLDEHTAALDPKMAKIVMNLTQEIILKNKLTALMVTHDMHTVNQYGNRLIVMQKGKIKQDIRDAEKEDTCAFSIFNSPSPAL